MTFTLGSDPEWLAGKRNMSHDRTAQAERPPMSKLDWEAFGYVLLSLLIVIGMGAWVWAILRYGS